MEESQPHPAPLGLSARIATVAQTLQAHACLSVPRYQRGYAWTAADVSRLLQDLRLAVSRDARFYFLGPVVLVTRGSGEAEIVDGQQRLATLAMLLAYLRDRAEKDVAASLQRLIAPRKDGGVRLRPTEHAFFHSYVHAQGRFAALAALRRADTDSQALLAGAAQAISEALGGFTALECAALSRFLLHRVVFSLMESDDRQGASLLFRVLNDRGRDLSDAAIIKSELLEAANLPEEEAETAAQQWDALEERLGREMFEKLLDLMPLIISGNSLETPGDLAAFRREVLQRVDAVRFLREEMPRYAEGIERVSRRQMEAGDDTQELQRRLTCLALLKDRFWLPAAVAYVADHLSEDHPATLRFFKGLERLAFVCFLGVIRPDRRYERFAQVVRARGRPEALYGRRGALELSEGERRQTIARLNEPFQRDPKVRRLVAWRLNAALGEAFEMTSHYTVEHVLPTRASGPWLKNFPDAAERETLAHLIGNWAIVTAKQNALAADRPFLEKQAIFFANGAERVRALTVDVADYRDWTPAVVRLRQEKLVARLCADWDLIARG